MNDRTTKWVVRSMTTTDYRIASRGCPEQQPQPYHIYLREPLRRASAYWASPFEAMLFDTPHAAEAEANRALSPDSAARAQIVPYCDQDIPTYWDIQDLNRARRAAA